MDRVPDGILIMLKDLEEYIVCAGLADMMASADIITQVIFIFYIDSYMLKPCNSTYRFGIINKI